MEGRCGTCRHFKAYPDSDEGDCRFIVHLSYRTEADSQLAFLLDAEGYSATLCVRADFGCVEFEEHP